MQQTDAMKHEIKPHNPHCKLIETTIETKQGYADVIYGENNDGTNQGLEVYFYKNPCFTIGQYHSRRWLLADVPKKYQNILLQLQMLIPQCPVGHKLILA